ncbi:Rtr1/RPAP2 family-domain-containing protein [Xylariaceae sp. FL0662B]|nr:Rtr1/RPAP2 family-domain-containing protein [Xylariaceae sp. FL0662B]
MSSQSQPKKPKKGILKKPTTTTATPSPPPSSNSSHTRPPQPDADARAVAEHHARIIHDRLALEDTIHASTLLLSSFPLSQTSSAARPAASDAALFRQHVRLFQPGDYEDLIAERNAQTGGEGGLGLGRCGYALCPRPRARLPGRAAYKLVGYGSPDFAVVPRAEYERWCSPACARRAMYVKVQLNETAAWERAGIDTIQIELLDEPELDEEEDEGMEGNAAENKDGNGDDGDGAVSSLAKGVEGMKIEAERKAVRDARELALERGDTMRETVGRFVDVTIREKTDTTAAEEPSLDNDAGGHLVLDGYKTKFDPRSQTVSKGSDIADATDGSGPAE